MDTNNKNDNTEKKKFSKETIYDKIDIPLKKLDNFILVVIIVLIGLTLFSVIR